MICLGFVLHLVFILLSVILIFERGKRCSFNGDGYHWSQPIDDFDVILFHCFPFFILRHFQHFYCAPQFKIGAKFCAYFGNKYREYFMKKETRTQLFYLIITIYS